MPASKKTRFDGVVVFPRERHLAPGDPLDTAKTDILWNNIHALGACNTSIRYNLHTSEAIPTVDNPSVGTRSGRLTLFPTIRGITSFPVADVLLQEVPRILHRAVFRVNLNNDNNKPFALDVKVKLSSLTSVGTGDLKVFFHFGNRNLLGSEARPDEWTPVAGTGPVMTNVLYCNIASTQTTTQDMTLYRYGTTTPSNVVLPETVNVYNYLERASHVPGVLGESVFTCVTYLTIWVISNKDLGSTTYIYLDGLNIREIPYDGVHIY